MNKKSDKKIDRDILKNFLWQEIIRLCFSPKTPEDQLSWIWVLNKDLWKFWEINDIPNPMQWRTIKLNSFEILFPKIGDGVEIAFNCTVESSGKYSVCVTINQTLRWVHHFDNSFFFPSLKNNTEPTKNRKTYIDSCSREEIVEVIDGLIFHPSIHLHLNNDKHSPEHKIRIGCSFYNPFLYLFHLRYQLCISEDRRLDEQERLVDLFLQSIKEDRPVSANKLMVIPKKSNN